MKLTNLQEQIYAGRVCPYCNKPTKYINSSVVYGADYGMIYYCRPCDAWVGVHKGTDTALGRVADGALRKAKITAHIAFDKLWKQGFMTRKKAYKWLGKELGLPPEFTHIGYFSVSSCIKVIKISVDKLKELKNGTPEKRNGSDSRVERKTSRRKHS